MKKILLALAAISLSATLFAQTFVDTMPANKKVIIEEFTGINCGYCPDGHKIANQIMADHPDSVWAINIHQGSYAANTYTTQWGNALANQTGLNGYPSGTVNRHVFSGSNTILSRGDWANATAQILNQVSPVNVAARATLDFDTRQMTIIVEVYYTDSSSVATNMLNIALLQNNIIGSQSGASSNPDQVVEGGKYRHMHMLRDLITGQWGQEITNTTAGSFYTDTITYTVPTTISGDNSHSEVCLDDIEVVVFIAEGHQEILTGCKAQMSYLNAHPMMKGLKAKVIENCDMEFSATATLNNLDTVAITAAELTYTIDGNTQTYNWTGNIAAGTTADIDLPAISGNFTSGQDYSLEVAFTSLNGEPFTCDSRTVTVSKTVYTTAAPLEIVLKTDKYGSETTLIFKKADGTILLQEDSYPNSAKKYIYNIDPAEAGCYILEVYDEYGDGINTGYGAGYFTLSNSEGQIFKDNGKFGSKAQYFINVTTNGSGSVGIADAANVHFNLYPNPANDYTVVESPSTIREVSVVNALGQQVYTNSNVNDNKLRINTQSYAAGIYMITITTDDNVATQRINIIK